MSKIGVAYTGRYNELFVTDYSKVIPVANLEKPYRILVPKTDAGGNDVGGVRVPDVAVPIATYTGWNLRKAGFSMRIVRFDNSLRCNGHEQKCQWRPALIADGALRQ